MNIKQKPKVDGLYGIKYFNLEWDDVRKTLYVEGLVHAVRLCAIPGRWGPRAEIGKAKRRPIQTVLTY